MTLSRKEDYKLRGVKSGDVQRKPVEERIKELEAIYGDKFTYDFSNYKKSSSKIGIICPKHGRDDVHLISLMKGRGCKQCKYETTKKFAYEFIPMQIRKETNAINIAMRNKTRAIQSKEIIENLENQYSDYTFKIISDELGIKTKVEVNCIKHGKSENTYERINENIYCCVFCSNTNRSYAEIMWLNDHKVTTRQKKIKKYRVDGYDAETKTVYEYLGKYWHGHPSEKNRTKNFNKKAKKTMDQLFIETEERFKLLQSVGYKIIYRWENEEVDFTFDGVLRIQDH